MIDNDSTNYNARFKIVSCTWLCNNRHKYECFISTTFSFNSEVSKCLQDGFYNGDLGNTMLLAMANTLKVSFVVFTSLSSSPVFIVAS